MNFRAVPIFCLAALLPAPAMSADPPKKDGDARPSPPKEKPFAEVVKDAKLIPGLFNVYRGEEKVYLEIAPGQFDRLYLLSSTLESGIGERGWYPAETMGDLLVSFRRQGKNVQMIGVNPWFRAQEGTPIERALRRSFSNSILGATKVESEPHPERKSVLIDLGAILLTDLPMLGYYLDATFRMGYRFDGKNSAFGTINGFSKNVELETLAHYAAERPPLPPLSPGPPTPSPPRNLVDVRSMTFHLRYSLHELPPPGYRPRLADDRVGHFLEHIDDFTSDVNATPAVRYVNRWRLEKADPNAAMSRPKQPIVFWLENTIPVKYRQAVREGALMWNRAFERIGFQDAIEVREQPDSTDWDAADVRYSTIRWILAPDAAFAQGPSRTNPLTGEIFDADIRFSEAITRYVRQEMNEEVNPLTAMGEATPGQAPASPSLAWRRDPFRSVCDFAQGAAADAAFAFDVLMTRGMVPDGPEADRFVQEFLRDITAHEVGHTLGLRHNFRASTLIPFEQLQNRALTFEKGLTGSVMDYNPTNVALRGQPQGEYFQSTLGPYDYWAIEYAYKPLNAATPEEELPELKRIASRVADPELAYGTDEDAGFTADPLDMDPTAARWDLGDDPLKYGEHRVALAREVFENVEKKLEKPGEGYQVLRRSFNMALSRVGLALYGVSRYIGGMYHYRDHVGDPGGRVPFQPAPAAKQKEALRLLRERLFSPQAFQFSPQLLNKLAVERFINWRNFSLGRFDYPIHGRILGMQTSVLNRLYHPVVMSRVLDSEVKFARSDEAFSLAEMFDGIQEAIWADARPAGASLTLNSYRRSLQREHLKKLVTMALRPDPGTPEDARNLARTNLTALRSQLRGALARPGLRMSAETRAHLRESLARIDEALRANVQRVTF